MFKTRRLHLPLILLAGLVLSIPNTTKAASPANHFKESLNQGLAREIPIVNAYNQVFIARHPTVKASFDILELPFNITAKTQARDLQSALNYKLDHSMGSAQSNPRLAPALEELLTAYLEAQPEAALESLAKPIERLRQELATTLATDRLNLEWAANVLPRLLVAQSCPRCDELELYEHVNPNRSTYRHLFENETWKKHDEFKVLLNRNSLLNSTYTPWSQEIDPHVQQAISLPPMAFVFSMNQTFVNPIMLVASYLHHLFPVTVPKAGVELGAHGIAKGEFSAFGFFYHDVFHAELFFKQRILEYYLDTQIRKAMSKGSFVPQFVAEFAPLAAARYQGLMNLFQVILDTGMHDNQSAARDSESMKLFKAAVAGLFEGVHEYPSFTEKMLEQTSASKIIDIFVTHAKLEIQSHLNWESAWNPLVTSAVDGHTELSDQQIVDVVLRLHKEQLRTLRFLSQEGVSEAAVVKNSEHLYSALVAEGGLSEDLKDLRSSLLRLSGHHGMETFQREFNSDAPEARGPERGAHSPRGSVAHVSFPLREMAQAYYAKLYGVFLDRTYRSKVESVEVIRSRRYIDVIFMLKNGSTEKITYPTQFHKFKNSEDNFKLMKYAGKVDPIFQALHDRAWEHPEDSKLVEQYMIDLQARLVGVLEDFQRLALEVIHRKPAGEGKGLTLETAYQEWIQSLDALSPRL